MPDPSRYTYTDPADTFVAFERDFPGLLQQAGTAYRRAKLRHTVVWIALLLGVVLGGPPLLETLDRWDLGFVPGVVLTVAAVMVIARAFGPTPNQAAGRVLRAAGVPRTTVTDLRAAQAKLRNRSESPAALITLFGGSYELGWLDHLTEGGLEGTGGGAGASDGGIGGGDGGGGGGGSGGGGDGGGGA